MGFLFNWFEDLSEQYSKNQNTPSQTKPQAELEQDIWQDEQLHPSKQPLPSAESLCEAVSFRATSTTLLGGDEKLLEHKRGERSSYAKRYMRLKPLSAGVSFRNPLGLKQNLSIPCLVRQPKQAEVKGIIRKDEGDCEALSVGIAF